MWKKIREQLHSERGIRILVLLGTAGLGLILLSGLLPERNLLNGITCIYLKLFDCDTNVTIVTDIATKLIFFKNRIGKGDSDFNDIAAIAFQLLHTVNACGDVRIACRQKADEGRFLFLLQSLEYCIDSIHECPPPDIPQYFLHPCHHVRTG